MRLSIIVTGRNDNYDGNFDERLELSLSKNIKSLPDAEFIFVEWNPYLDRPLTSEKLQKIFKDRIKYYVVDPKFHSQYCTIDGFLEYPAKNVGVRRAQGDFILCTNSDIVFSPQVTDAVKSPLNPDIVYRATRVDIPADYTDISFPLKAQYKLRINSGPLNASGDFLLLHRNIWFRSTGFCEAFPNQRIHKDAFLVYILTKIYNLDWINLGIITHWQHKSSWSVLYEKRPGIGDPKWDFRYCGHTKNADTWGLSFASEENRNGIIWLT